MTNKALIELVQKIQAQKFETQNLEIKSAHDGTPKRLYDTLSSFSNQNGGGIIVFGMTDDCKIVGVYDVKDLQNQVTEQCKQMEPEIRPVFTICDIDEKIVASIEIPEIDVFARPCFYKGAGRLKGSYVRVGEQDIQMNEYEVYSFESFKRKIHDDLKVAEGAKKASLDTDALGLFLTKLRLAKAKFKSISEEETLELQGITKDGGITIAGLMNFGKYPQSFFPQLSITAMVVNGMNWNELDPINRFIDNQRIDGTIPEMLESALAFVRRNMKIATIIDPHTAKRADKEEYPLVAVREIILNALIHRDYSVYTSGTPIRLLIYPNRLEVENPGGLYGRLTVDRLGSGTPADTRNQYIADILEVSIDNENRYSGIPTIRNVMKEHDLPEPIFQSERGQFKVTLYNASANITNKDNASLIEFCKKPRTREEIAKHLNINSISYLVTIYLKPMIDKGLLKLTIPNAPRSKNQKYFS